LCFIKILSLNCVPHKTRWKICRLLYGCGLPCCGRWSRCMWTSWVIATLTPRWKWKKYTQVPACGICSTTFWLTWELLVSPVFPFI